MISEFETQCRRIELTGRGFEHDFIQYTREPFTQLALQLKPPLVVDPYQRDYAWTFATGRDDDSNEGEVTDFIYDLKRLIDESKGGADVPPYFFGLVVTAKQPNDGWSTNVKHEIVDGQQRLTTFVLMASAMVRIWELIGKEAEEAGESVVVARCKSFQNLMKSKYIQTNLPEYRRRLPGRFPCDLLSRRMTMSFSRTCSVDSKCLSQPGHSSFL